MYRPLRTSRDLVRPGVGFDLPVVVGYPVWSELMEVFRHDTDGVFVHQLLGRPRRGALHSDDSVAVGSNIDHLRRVVVVVPGRDDFLRSHEVAREFEIGRGHRYAVGPACVVVDPVVHRLAVRIERPMRGQRRNRAARIRMPLHEAHLVVSKKRSESAVRIRPDPTERQRKRLHRGAEGTAAFRFWRGEGRILVVSDPDETVRKLVGKTERDCRQQCRNDEYDPVQPSIYS